MSIDIPGLLIEQTGARKVIDLGAIQSLWEGYGGIGRYSLEGGEAIASTVVVKHICLPDQKQRARQQHKRGWNTELSHQRKVNSYRVEVNWYKDHVAREKASFLEPQFRTARCYGCVVLGDESIIIMEDLDAAGFSRRFSSPGLEEARLCISWLANFHARYLNVAPVGLWHTGTYWHLATRPDELEALDNHQLKSAAGAIDKVLSECPYQTFVHGDAKIANFCFDTANSQVAAVDFQYVGGGCGMKDLVYFIGSCFDEYQCELLEDELLDYYFSEFESAIARFQPAIDAAKVEKAWRPLFGYAWADFYRFISGWSPGHPKANAYSKKITCRVLNEIKQR